MDGKAKVDRAAGIEFGIDQKAEAYEIFKKIRNHLRKVRPEEVVHYCIRQLNPGRSFTYQEIAQRPPWLYLIIIKWAVVHGDFLNPKRRALRVRDIEEILALMVCDLWGAVRLPNDYDSHYLYMRSALQQQLWFQQNFFIAEIGRQSIFFRDLQDDHGFRRKFLEASGIELNAFLELSFALAGRFLINETVHSVREEFFRNLTAVYPPGTVASFLSALSRDFQTLRTSLEAINPGRSVLYEFIEPTPLSRFPLLKDNGQYYCYMVHLLYRSLQGFVYAVLRSAEANAFITKFGPLFEKYLARGLSYASIDYLVENELATRLTEGSQLVDYAILAAGNAILIDAKAIELTELGMLAHRAEVVADKVKPVFKAIDQGFEVAHRLRFQGLINDSSCAFLLVVTYGDLLLGTGPDFYEYVGQRRIDEFAQKHGGSFPIPLEHIYFLSINDFDLLMEHIRSSGTSLLDFLLHVASLNSDRRNSSIVFRGNIPGAIARPSFPQYLSDESLERLGGRLRALLQNR
jgi:hypothetical protein